jgi:hypothetical protein
MTVIIQKNKKFFDELAQFNPKLARILDEEHGWTDKLVHRSQDASISQPRRRQEGTTKAGNNQQDQTVASHEMGRN